MKTIVAGLLLYAVSAGAQVSGTCRQLSTSVSVDTQGYDFTVTELSKRDEALGVCIRNFHPQPGNREQTLAYIRMLIEQNATRAVELNRMKLFLIQKV
jgi:hypothetical protein